MPTSNFYLKRSSKGTVTKEYLRSESVKKREERDKSEYTIYYEFYYGAKRPFRYCTKENILICDWEEWDGRGNIRQRINSRVTGSARINLRLDEIKTTIETAEKDFRKEGIRPSHAQLLATLEAPRIIPDEVTGINFTQMSFYDFFTWYSENEIKKGDVKNFSKTLVHLTQYNPRLNWDSINVYWYRKYMDWLTTEYKNPRTRKQEGVEAKKGILNSTAAKDTRVLITILKAAKKRGIKVTDDYDEYERPYFDPKATSRQYITKERLEEVFEFDFTKRDLYDRRAKYSDLIDAILKARDIYAFSFDTGLAHAELQGCYPDQIVQEYNLTGGLAYCLSFGRGKTQRANLIPLSNRCIEIIKKYQGQQETILPIFSNHAYNNALKRMFKLAGFTRKITLVRPMGAGQRIDTYEEWEILTSHTGRHSAATNILEKTNGDLVMARDLLGHKSVTTTEIYARNRKEVFISNILKVVNENKEES